jgi:hypothetical protein
MRINQIKKIAVCLSGEIRTWRDNYITWKNIVDDTDIEVDFFMHFWDSQLPININRSKINSSKLEKIEDIPVSKEDIDDLINTIKPISYQVEKKKQFTPYNPNQPLFLNPQLSQWYAFMKVANLKSDYEIKNNFIYDLVLRFRYDIKLNSILIHQYNKPKFGEIHGTHYGCEWDGHEMLIHFADLLWYSDSVTFDILSNYYFEIPKIKGFKQGIKPEYVWHAFCSKNSLDIYQTGRFWDFKINRKNKII